MRITRWVSALSGALVVVGALVAMAGSARADDSIFDGLMPGQVVPEEELACYFGGAQINISGSDGSLITTNGAIDTNQLNSLGNFSGTGGVNTVLQSTGDYNNNNVTVNIEVNINTVTVRDSAGAVISTNQNLDFGGGVISGVQ